MQSTTKQKPASPIPRFGKRKRKAGTRPKRYYLLDGDELRKLEKILDNCGM